MEWMEEGEEEKCMPLSFQRKMNLVRRKGEGEMWEFPIFFLQKMYAIFSGCKKDGVGGGGGWVKASSFNRFFFESCSTFQCKMLFFVWERHSCKREGETPFVKGVVERSSLLLQRKHLGKRRRRREKKLKAFECE